MTPTGWTLGEWHEPESRGRFGYMTVDVPGHAGAIRVYGDDAEAMAEFIAHAPDVAAATEALLTAFETSESKLRAELYRIAYLPFGDSEATHAEVLNAITDFARAALGGGTP